MKGKFLKSSIQFAPFLVIPLALLATGWLYTRNSGLYFLHCVDPEYAYLFNGLTLACLHPDLNCVGHPGTPIQVLIALVCRVVHLFRSGQPMLDDVLLNPEVYIHASLYSVHVLNAVALFFLGKYAFRYSHNLVVALVLQLAPFMHTVVLECTGRLIPELIMPAILCVWIILLMKLMYDRDSHDYKKYALWFALLFGFSMADKLTFLPFFLLPFIILPTWKFRLRFTLFSFISFLIFAFPVLFHLPKFYRWVTGIFMHKGVYGGGERGIVDWGVFIENLKAMWVSTRLLIIPFGILAVVGVITIIRQRKSTSIEEMPVRIFIGLSALLLVQYLITAKHYALYYMTPSLLFAAFVIFMVWYFLGQLFPGAEKKKILTILLGVLGLWFIITKAPLVVRNLNRRMEATDVKTEAYQKIAPLLKNTPKIICPFYYGCSTVEYALTFGLHESGRHGHFIFESMKRLYPSTYMYFPWGKVFYEGNKEILPEAFLHPSIIYTLYIADYSPQKLDEILSKLETQPDKFKIEAREIIQLPNTAESIFSLRFVSAVMSDSIVKTVQ